MPYYAKFDAAGNVVSSTVQVPVGEEADYFEVPAGVDASPLGCYLLAGVVTAYTSTERTDKATIATEWPGRWNNSTMAWEDARTIEEIAEYKFAELIKIADELAEGDVEVPLAGIYAGRDSELLRCLARICEVEYRIANALTRPEAADGIAREWDLASGAVGTWASDAAFLTFLKDLNYQMSYRRTLVAYHRRVIESAIYDLRDGMDPGAIDDLREYDIRAEFPSFP